jgi:hypothetical protein
MTAATVITLVLTTPAAPDLPPPAPDVKASVNRGLKWLAVQQKPDGSWPAANGLSAAMITGTAGLALLMEGSTPQHGTYAPQLRKAVAWVENNAQEDGLIGTTQGDMYQYMNGHMNALLFLACAYDADDDPERRARVGKVLAKAVAYASAGQTARGGWGYVKPSVGNTYDDSLSTANMLHALFAARRAGIDVPRKATDAAELYLVRSTAPDGGVISTLSDGGTPVNGAGVATFTASAAATLLAVDGRRPVTLPLWVRSAGTNTEQQVQFLRNGGAYGMIPHYHMARVAHALGDDGYRRLDRDAPDDVLVRWSAYRAKVFKVLMEFQLKDGNWTDGIFGPSYPTAIALMILQLDNDYLPAFSR